LEIINQLKSYTEISPSGCGVHILVKAKLTRGQRIGTVEAYDRGRYFTMTGLQLAETPTTIEDRQAEVTALLAEKSQGKKVDGHRTRPAVDSLDKDLIPQNLRRNYLAHIGIVMRKWGLSEKAIAAGLLALYRVQCDPTPEPVPESEIVRTARSAFSYKPDKRLLR